MKKTLSIVLIVIIAVSSALSPSAYVTGNTTDFYYTDRSGAYHISCSGKRAVIDRYASTNRSAQLDLRHTVNAVCGFGGNILLLCNDPANNQLVVYTYSLDRDALDSFCIYGAKLYNDIVFCCAGKYLYIENCDNSKELKKYSFEGSFIRSYSFNYDITSVFCGYAGGVYIVGGSALYHIDGESFTALSGASVSPDLFAANENYLVSAMGDVYRVSNGVERLFRMDTSSVCSSACVIGNMIYSLCNSEIIGYDLKSGEKVCSYTCRSSPLLLYSNGGSIIAADKNSSYTISRDDFTEFNRGNTDSSSSDKQNSNEHYSNNDTSKEISSKKYRVSFTDYKISAIPAGTTVAGFKSDIAHKGYSVALYRDNIEKKSGNVGTAWTAIFSSDDDSIQFELSVTGDITGEGSVNSRDLKLLMDYLIGSADYNGVYLLSSDLSDDGKVDVIDLAMMAKRI